jgi:cytochrome c
MSRSIKGFAVAAAAICLSAPTLAQEDMLKKYGCLACHTIDKKLVGPAYTDVAAKYKGQSDAPDKLYEKVRRGGQGVWGQIPMPPNPTVPEPDLRSMIKFILSH